jgi:hypothetical protein
MSTRMLSEADIYDVYGIEWVMRNRLDEEDERLCDFRLTEIQSVYVHACKNRIRAEAAFLGVKNVGEITIAQMLEGIREAVGTAIQKSMFDRSEDMMHGGGFNLMGTILSAHQAAGSAEIKGVDLSRFGVVAAAPVKTAEVDVDWFMDTKKAGGRVTNDPKWAEIAKAYLAVEQATSSKDIIASIDRLNDLQHNSFHVLIDLQTGRMLNKYENATDDREARKRLQEILDLKKNAAKIEEFSPKMSSEVRKLITKYRGTTRRA